LTFVDVDEDGLFVIVVFELVAAAVAANVVVVVVVVVVAEDEFIILFEAGVDAASVEDVVGWDCC